MLSSGWNGRKARFTWVTREDGTSEFQDFLDAIDSKARAKLLARIKEIETHGLDVATRLLWVKKLEKNLYEIRVDSAGNQYRSLYFHAQDDLYVITHGFAKKTQKTPRREKTHARTVRDLWKRGNHDS